jgi:hypothetical protein
MKPSLMKLVNNPYAKKRQKTKPTTTWNNRWNQTATNNKRVSHRKVVTVSPNANVMDQVGGTCSYGVPPGTIIPHPSNPTFFLPMQEGTSLEDSSEKTDEESEDDEVYRRISLLPPAPAKNKRRVSGSLLP